MRSLIALIVAILLFSPLGQEVSASSLGSLESIHSEATINNDGTVDIKQTWRYDDTNVFDGTEHYINMNVSYGHDEAAKGKEAITDYVVYRNGTPMEFDENWDINNSFDYKAGKYGVIEVGKDEIELTFGITERTLNEFVVEYKIHNVVKETEDGYKYLHWTFLPTELSPSPQRLTAEIHVQDGVEIDKVYGFNYEGQVGFLHDQRNAVYAEMNQGRYKSNTTLNIFTLLKDENDLIKGTYNVDMTLEEKAKQILKGSDYDLDHFYSEHFEPIASSEDPWWKQFFSFNSLILLLTSFFPLLFFVGILSFVITLGGARRRSLIKNMDKDEVKKLTKDKNFYYRDEPDESANSTELIRELIVTSKMDNNILSYYISKWTSEGVFEYLYEEEEKVLFFTTNVITFKIHKDKFSPKSQLEEQLFGEFYKLTNKDGVITTKNLSQLNMSKITKYMKKHKENAYLELEKMGYVVDNRNKGKSSSKKGIKFIRPFKPTLTKKGEELVFQHAGLKNYLEQFTLINERTSSEIELWDYYFYMAALYGVADKFKKELKDMPNLSEEGRKKYNMYYGNTGTSALSNTVSNIVSSAYSSHNSSSSSSGGGGGSSGGGSGGGTR